MEANPITSIDEENQFCFSQNISWSDCGVVWCQASFCLGSVPTKDPRHINPWCIDSKLLYLSPLDTTFPTFNSNCEFEVQ